MVDITWLILYKSELMIDLPFFPRPLPATTSPATTTFPYHPPFHCPHLPTIPLPLPLLPRLFSRNHPFLCDLQPPPPPPPLNHYIMHTCLNECYCNPNPTPPPKKKIRTYLINRTLVKHKKYPTLENFYAVYTKTTQPPPLNNPLPPPLC